MNVIHLMSTIVLNIYFRIFKDATQNPSGRVDLSLGVLSPSQLVQDETSINRVMDKVLRSQLHDKSEGLVVFDGFSTISLLSTPTWRFPFCGTTNSCKYCSRLRLKAVQTPKCNKQEKKKWKKTNTETNFHITHQAAPTFVNSCQFVASKNDITITQSPCKTAISQNPRAGITPTSQESSNHASHSWKEILKEMHFPSFLGHVGFKECKSECVPASILLPQHTAVMPTGTWWIWAGETTRVHIYYV